MLIVLAFLSNFYRSLTLILNYNRHSCDQIIYTFCRFDIGKRICAHGLCPMIEPEIDINSPEKAQAEIYLKESLLNALSALNDDQLVMLKLTLPEVDNFYREVSERA